MLVTPDWCRLMARYNAWQNGVQLRIVEAMPEEELTRDRGAFWRSILGTLSHILYADRVWLHRLAGLPRPEGTLAASDRLVGTASDWAGARRQADADLAGWAAALTPAALEGDLTWTSPAAGGVVTKPRGLIVTHLFNHQTHHRGQVHAMLTAAGQRPGDTDLAFIPD